MNVFFVSGAALDSKNSVGSTIENWFYGNVWKDCMFGSFYTRNQLPCCSIRVDYYNLVVTDIIKGFFKGKISEKQFSNVEIKEIEKTVIANSAVEKANINRLHKYNLEFPYFVYEIIWMSKVWLNNKFKSFLFEKQFDALFSFATNEWYLWPIIEYLKENTNCKIALFIADDVYGSYDSVVFYRRWYLKSWFKKCIMAADKLYGASEELCVAYSKIFSREITPLYKGCDLSLQPKGYLNDVLRIVYAGNLFYGRAETLGKLAEVLEKMNQNGLKAILEIYTGTTITEKFDKLLNRGDSSRIMGSRQYEEIKKIMHEADVVLHVESFEQKQIDYVHYSFSTKIIDCLQSGSQVLAIGPKDIASIEYLQKVDGAVVIDDLRDIEHSLSVLMEDREKMLQNIVATREYALIHHEIGNVQKRLHEDLEKLIAEK